MRKAIIFIFIYLFSAGSIWGQDIPHLKKNENNITQLIVNGKPYIMLAGELMNSSASTLESMAPKWKQLKALNLNTVLATIAWEQIEPEEGQYDFSIVEGLIKEARRHDLKLVFLWFGSWKNGSSGYAPHWVMRNTGRFPRMENDKGENRPFLSNFSENLIKADSKVFGALMNFIKNILCL